MKRTSYTFSFNSDLLSKNKEQAFIDPAIALSMFM